MSVAVVMPKLGEAIVEGTITRWHVKEGDVVTKDQMLLTVSTDKADTDVPSPVSGVVTKILAAEQAVVPVEVPILEIEEGAAAPVQAAAPVAPAAPAPAPSEARREPPTTPAVRNLARELEVDLGAVQGSGERGRVTKGDVIAHSAKSAPPAAAPAASPAPARVSEAPKAMASGPSPSSIGIPGFRGAYQPRAYTPSPGDVVKPFSRRRRIISDHMVYSKHVAPHVYTFAEVDMHRVSKLREAKKAEWKAEGVSLTFLAFIAAATARALRESPALNSRVLEDASVQLKEINLGVAVETPGGLLVPVVRNADELTVKGLARAIDALARKARDGKIEADDLSGSTFTISNPGPKGNFVGAAVINQPNVGILRTGEIVKRPVVVEVEGVDTIAIHPVMFCALSYDHRIVDGVAANDFLYRVTELIEAGDFAL